jgi:predicted CopG family antitoxin
MATKTISLKLEAYEKLKRARRYKGESFSEVVLRATWPEETITAGELLELCRKRGPILAEEMIERVEQLKQADRAPKDKWKNHSY